MYNPFRKKQTLKILFINPAGFEMKTLLEAVKKLPIIVVFDRITDKAYIVDTGIEVRK